MASLRFHLSLNQDRSQKYNGPHKHRVSIQDRDTMLEGYPRSCLWLLSNKQVWMSSLLSEEHSVVAMLVLVADCTLFALDMDNHTVNWEEEKLGWHCILPLSIRSGIEKEVLHILNIMKVCLVRYVSFYRLENVRVSYKISGVNK